MRQVSWVAFWRWCADFLSGDSAEHETEISFFIMKDYEEFKANPEEKW